MPDAFINQKQTRHITCIRHLVTVARNEGLALTDLIADSALTPGQLEQTSFRIQAWQEITVIRNLLKLAGRPGLGFSVGKLYRPTSYGPLGWTMIAATTLSEALQTLDRYQGLGMTLAQTSLQYKSGKVQFLIDTNLLPGDIRNFVAERAVAAIVRLANDLLGYPMPPGTISLRAPAPENIDVSPLLQPWEIEYEADRDALFFSPASLKAPLPWAHVDAFEHGNRICLATFHELSLLEPLNTPIASRVQQALLQSPSLTSNMSQVATQLNLSKRTLSRKLSEEGLSFREISDKVRQRIAEQLLLHSQNSPKSIAETLCYSDETSFLRAFRRWTGTTPKQWTSTVLNDKKRKDAINQTLGAGRPRPILNA